MTRKELVCLMAANLRMQWMSNEEAVDLADNIVKAYEAQHPEPQQE